MSFIPTDEPLRYTQQIAGQPLNNDAIDRKARKAPAFAHVSRSELRPGKRKRAAGVAGDGRRCATRRPLPRLSDAGKVKGREPYPFGVFAAFALAGPKLIQLSERRPELCGR